MQHVAYTAVATGQGACFTDGALVRVLQATALGLRALACHFQLDLHAFERWT